MTPPAPRRPVTLAVGPALGCAVLFLLPFAAGGVFAGVQAARAARAADWGQAGLLTIFALVFGGVGIGGIALVLGGRRRAEETAAREARHPDEPWLWRHDWAVRRVSDSSRGEMWGAWVFAALWNLVSVPAAVFGVRAALGQGNRAALVALLFPAIGAGLLVWAVRATLRRRRFGTSVLELATLPAAIGHTLEGTVRTPVWLRPPEGFRATLTCLRRVTTGGGRNRSTSETVLWQDEQTVQGTGVGVPIAFALPADAPPADPLLAGDRTFWRLAVTAKLEGIDYASAFEVPVFRTAASGEPPTPAERAVAARTASVEGYRQPPNSRIEVRETRRGTEIWFPAGRNPGMAAGLTAFTALWTGIVAALVLLEAPLVFPVVFGGFGLLLLAGVVDQWLAVTRVTAGDGAITVATGLLAPGRERTLRAAEIREIAPRITMQAGSTPYYELSLVTADGKRVAAGRGIHDKREAEWLAATLRRAAGLP